MAIIKTSKRVTIAVAVELEVVVWGRVGVGGVVGVNGWRLDSIPAKVSSHVALIWSSGKIKCIQPFKPLVGKMGLSLKTNEYLTFRVSYTQ